MLKSGHILEFQIGEIVYLTTDKEQLERVVLGITLRPNGGVTYGLGHGVGESWHYSVEITSSRDIVKATIG